MSGLDLEGQGIAAVRPAQVGPPGSSSRAAQRGPAASDAQTVPGREPAPERAGLLAARDFLEVRFGGTGAQGVILMGVVLAMAATRDHRYVVQTQTYGLGTRGGYGRSDIIISDQPIDYPELQSADLLVALSQDSADGYAELLRPDSILVYESENVTRPPVFVGTSFGVPFARLATEAIGQRDRTADVLALGAVVAITGVVSVRSLRKAVMSTVQAGTEEANEKALDRGLSLDPEEWLRSGTCS